MITVAPEREREIEREMATASLPDVLNEKQYTIQRLDPVQSNLVILKLG